MTDINEKETIAYFIHGIHKAKSAAKELATLNSRGAWLKVRTMLGQLEKNAQKLYTSKAQTRTETLIMANQILRDSETIH
jgi:hypothetical protein